MGVPMPRQKSDPLPDSAAVTPWLHPGMEHNCPENDDYRPLTSIWGKVRMA
jgi:hypothetical protein